jgi:dipeptidyl aminopeptidase/acylaminoacyl peptidase
LHNDQDGVVPWQQGIEMFMALNRLGKPVWLANYSGQGHSFSAMASQKDWATRMQQFFDYYLKDEQAPAWLDPRNQPPERDSTLTAKP